VTFVSKWDFGVEHHEQAEDAFGEYAQFWASQFENQRCHKPKFSIREDGVRGYVEMSGKRSELDSIVSSNEHGEMVSAARAIAYSVKGQERRRGHNRHTSGISSGSCTTVAPPSCQRPLCRLLRRVFTAATIMRATRAAATFELAASSFLSLYDAPHGVMVPVGPSVAAKSMSRPPPDGKAESFAPSWAASSPREQADALKCIPCR
jgi:hypothetical protein